MFVLVNIYQIELKYYQSNIFNQTSSFKKQIILLVVLEFWCLCTVKQGCSFDVLKKWHFIYPSEQKEKKHPKDFEVPVFLLGIYC